MASISSKGNCYLCGAELTKAAFKKHAMTAHLDESATAQDCTVLKVEGAYNKNYWLYLDISSTSTLKALDDFLREIWLECCGHMSAFFTKSMEQIGLSKRIKALVPGEMLRYEYDFGSTTELVITVVGRVTRPKQQKAVRLLGRNQPYEFLCHDCGQKAYYICTECSWNEENPFYCKSCANSHEHDEMLLPVTNLPRMGECGYCGELDVYEFDAAKLK